MTRKRNPVFFRKIISGVSSGNQNKIHAASAALVHNPEIEYVEYASPQINSNKKIKNIK